MPDRRTLLRQIATGTALTTAGAGVTAARGRGARRGASAETGVVATADDLGFDTLLAAVAAADPVVLDTLTDGDQYTVFAPTDAAFVDFFDTVESATGIDRATLLTDPDDLLTETLLYHVTEGRRYAASVVNAPRVDTLLGESVSVDGTTLDGRATITTTDVEASNGVVHGIDAVLTTPTVDQLL